MMKQKSFTVLELLIVIAVAAILASVVFAVFKEASQRARIAQGWVFSDSLRAALQADMVAWWPLDKIEGGKTPDMYFNQLHGTVYGNVTETEGIVNGALSFDGNDYVYAVDSPSLSITGDLTIQGWIKTSSTATQTILTKWNAANYKRSYMFGIYLNSLELGISDDGTGAEGKTGTIAVNDGKWHSVAAVYDATAETVDFYVDGYLDRQQTFTTETGAINDNDSELRIGATGGTAAYFFNGLIDNVQIYNAALPSAVIQQHYAEGLKRHQNLAKK